MACGYRMGIIGSLSLVPDGRTVTPINDVSTWLKCAGISTTTYTTLAEVLADASLLRTLINSENAMDYLVRCKEWIKQEALVPTMTSDTEPSGQVIYSSEYNTSSKGYYAFDGTTNSWQGSTTTNQWVGYHFTEPVKLYKFTLSPRIGGAGPSRQIKNYKIEGSNDGTNYTELFSGIIESGSSVIEVSSVLTNTETYSYARVYVIDSYANVQIGVSELQFYNELGVTDNASAMQLIGANDYASNLLLGDEDWLEAICNSAYFESVLNVKVPTMTSNTTPSGECSGSSIYSSNLTYDFWKAFDGNNNTQWIPNTYAIGQWLQYMFTESRKIYMAKGIVGNTAYQESYTYKIQGSNDGVNYTDSSSEETILKNASSFLTYFISNNFYKYFRFYWTSTCGITNGYVNLTSLQFYGRVDGGVQSWLLAAGITNKNYTTVAQVLADSDLLPVLIASHSGMDYLATCVAFANEICANETAMQLIGADNYAADTLLSNETWLKAICNSTYFESVLNAKVPTMTSNTTPEGVCIGDATNGTYNYQTFDGNDTSRSYVTNQIGKTIGYHFTSGCKVKKVFFKPYWSGDTYNVEGSNDGNTWNNIGSIIGNVSGSTAVVNATIDYTYYRFNQTTKISSSNLQEFLTAQFYGRQDV